MEQFRFATILTLVSFLFLITAFGQQQKDRIIKHTVWKAEAIKVVNVKVKNKTVNLKEKFVENDDWLKDFSIQVENTSSQTVVYLEILISFPQDENGMPPAPATETLRYGVFPPPPGERPNLKISEPPLEPSDKATSKLDSYEALQRLLDYAGHPASIGEVTIRTGRVILADETMWEGGQIFKRDPNDPKRWRVQQKQQII